MTKKVRRIAACCMMGLLVLAGGAKTAYAAGEPVAGIVVLLNETDISDIIEPIIEYHDLAIVNVTNYVNIRSEASTAGKLVGKLYSNGTCTVLSREGEWTKVKSGNVTGYIMSRYLYTGQKVYEMADSIKTKLATVKARVLNVRAKAGTNYDIVTQVPQGFVMEVLDEQQDWVKVSIGDKTGYVHSAYVGIETGFKQAVSVEEEQAIENLEKNRQSSSLRQQIVNYALKFLGNPYVWGGTSLTKGADCSGFTQSVLKKFGIYIPRTSREQARGGRRVSFSNMKPGDLIFYTRNGVVNHVAMYIGNGKVVGAASRREGITIKDFNYRTPYKAVSYINN